MNEAETMCLLRVVACLSLVAAFGCTRPLPFKDSQSPNASTQETPAKGSPWGPGCNDNHLKNGAWSLDRAPDFPLSPTARAKVDKVIAEVRGGYGGTLVTAPPDQVLDTPAFLSQYLRAFADPPDLTPDGLHSYDYRFERILERISGATGMLEDSKLDWDIWRAYLEYENRLLGAGSYSDEMATHGLDSAKDLLWMYLEHNFEAIRRDRSRLDAWIQWLTLDLSSRGGRPLRRWYLLRLVSLADDVTPKLAEEQEARESAERKEIEKTDPGVLMVTGKGTPWHPFLVVHPNRRELDLGEDPAPTFRVAIQRIARAHGLSYAVLGVKPDEMPPTRNWEINLSGRAIQVWIEHVLDQESWSNEHHGYTVHMYSPIGRRSSYSNVYLPKEIVTDGVFFFTFRGCLYVWPKSRMDDAALDMLHRSGLIDDAGRAEFDSRGFAPLRTCLQGQ